MKKVTFLSLVLTFTVFLVGCNSSNQATANTTVSNSNSENDSSQPGTNDARADTTGSTIVEEPVIVDENVQAVINLVRSNSSKFIDTKNYEDGAKRVVYRCNNKQYTIYLSDEPGRLTGVLSFWVRPIGTTSNKQMMTFSDEDFDGDIDLGLSGDSDNPKKPKAYAFFEGYETLEEKKAARKFWQKQFDQAVSDAQKCLGTSL